MLPLGLYFWFLLGLHPWPCSDILSVTSVGFYTYIVVFISKYNFLFKKIVDGLPLLPTPNVSLSSLTQSLEFLLQEEECLEEL